MNSSASTHPKRSAARGPSRRRFLAALGAAATLGFAAPWLGCRRQPVDALQGALWDLYGEPDDALAIARTSEWTPERALGVVRGSLTPEALADLALDPAALRDHLDARRSRDIAELRLTRVGLWNLPETEVAIAVLMTTTGS